MLTVPRREALRSYIGMGDIDPKSIRDLDRCGLAFDVVAPDSGEDLIYRVEWRRGHATVEEFVDLKRIGHAEAKGLDQAFFMLARQQQRDDNIPASWLRLAEQISDRAYVTFPMAGDPPVMFFPSIYMVTIQVLVEPENQPPTIFRPDPIGGPGTAPWLVSVEADQIEVAGLVRHWADGEITVDALLAGIYMTPMRFADATLRALGPYGEKPEHKEWRAVVNPCLTLRPEVRAWYGDRDELLNYAIVRARDPDEWQALVNYASELLRDPSVLTDRRRAGARP